MYMYMTEVMYIIHVYIIYTEYRVRLPTKEIHILTADLLLTRSPQYAGPLLMSEIHG